MPARTILPKESANHSCLEAVDLSHYTSHWILIERGGNVNDLADHLNLDDVMKFERHQELWERLKVGISDDGPEL